MKKLLNGLREVFDVDAQVVNHPILKLPVFLPCGVRGQLFKEK